MSQELPPGCDLKCLIKWFEDNQGNAADLKQIADHGEKLFWRMFPSMDAMSAHPDLIAALPALIAEERMIHALIKKHRARWRRALGYKGQGLPASEVGDYQ